MCLSPDPRDVFAKALIELLNQRPIESISVREIVEKCSTSRTTFYRYFNDKFDLMAYVYESRVKELIQASTLTRCGDYELALKIISFMYSERSFFKKAFATAGQNSFFDFYHRYTVEVWMDRAKRLLHVDELPEDLRIMISGHLMCTCSIVREWMLSGSKQSPEYIAHICNDICPEKLRFIQRWADGEKR